eukprot:1934469-Pyramimonas_sp.AAC.1
MRDQCHHGLQDSEGALIQKRIKLASSISPKRTAHSCQYARPHARLVGSAQAAKTRICPDKLRKNLPRDILRTLQRVLIHQPVGPVALDLRSL